MKLFLSVALVTLALVHGQDLGSQVDTHYGKVKGGLGLSREGRMFYSFQGIPYAKAPQRFQAPEVPDNWEGVKDVSKPAPACIQYDPFLKSVIGQEDCLTLNVFTPKLPMPGQDKILLPVVVYLHPGLNKFWHSENFNAKYWMDEDVIVVIPNWRQSLFGFLNTNDMYAAGNQGLRDQVQALKWVKQNIESFGGDSSRVTLMGSGSGGSDATLHLLSAPSKGLVSNVISMGGSPLSRIAFVRNPVKQAKKIGQQVGCPVDSSQALVSCLKQKDAKEILDKMVKPDFKNVDVAVLEQKALFGPTVERIVTEGQTEQDLILSDHPLNLLAGGKIVNKVPLIIGGNEYSGVTALTAALLKDPALMEKLDKQWNELAPLIFFYKDTASDKDAVTAKIREFYFGDKPITKDVIVNVTDIFMDRFMGYPLVVTAKLFSKEAPVYLYYFSHQPETTSMKLLGVDTPKLGMGHLDDLQYLFKVQHDKLAFPEIRKESSEYELSRGLVKLLSSFIETGKPTKTWGQSQEWKKNEGGELVNWYKMGTNSELQSAPEKFQKRVGFWVETGKLLAKENEKPEVESF